MKISEFLNIIKSEIQDITETYQTNAKYGFSKFINFIESIKPIIDQMKGLQENPLFIGKISPRLLQDPLSLENLNKKRSPDEKESYVMSYLIAILKLIYYSVFKLNVWDYESIKFEERITKGEDISKFDVVRKLIDLIIFKIENSDLDLGTDIKLLFTGISLKNKKQQDKKSFLSEEKVQLDKNKEKISFTSRLIAYHRAEEAKSENLLIKDPFAEKLAGTLDQYKEKHRFTLKRRDYSIVRAYHIERNLLRKWCERYNESQIVILGSGLDTRAYRLEYLKKGNHIIFELDYESVLSYKEDIMKFEHPYCKIKYIYANIGKNNIIKMLKEESFNPKSVSFWILEGLAYYLQKDSFKKLLKRVSNLSKPNSEIFIDLCVPAIANLRFGQFTTHFKWGINKDQIPDLFKNLGWNISAKYADDFDQGRDVGHRGMIFIHGLKKPSF
ncbi:MAG: SAM-dependent methyltransferase [Candidatus Lokiarchaeota archaeon]|nr:SAM-dependent methyltransferase [Candidatus Lokiarchaeota archaeon]MBD3199595.1 SAM-dependent methyltransferase [Candidatus Lokiarchaeota archaeon]